MTKRGSHSAKQPRGSTSPTEPSTDKRHTRLHADRPILDPNQDLLGYTPFAIHLTDIIEQVNAHSGVVLAINGEWGSGKSSLINLVLRELNAREATAGKRTVLIKFNPWLYPSQSDLFSLFFAQLCANLKIQNVANEFEAAVKDIKLFANLAKPIGWLPGVGRGVDKVLGIADTVIASAEKLAKATGKDITGLKESIETALREANRRILVVIDDLDRLTDCEIQQTFQLVKSLANFPNVIYLLAFDRLVVNKALDGVTAGKGEEYVKKIVQVSFDLPQPDQNRFLEFLERQIRSAFPSGVGEGNVGEAGEAEGSKSSGLVSFPSWSEELVSLISPFLRTPRHVNRLMNRITIVPRHIFDDLNLIDFIVLQTIQEFQPECYAHLWHHRDHLLKYQGDLASRIDLAQGKQLENPAWKVIQQHPKCTNHRDEQALGDMLEYLFPNARAQHLSTSVMSEDRREKWRAQNRLCTREHFDTYFTLSISSNGIPTKMVLNFIEALNQAGDAHTILGKLVAQDMQNDTFVTRTFVKRVFDFTEKLDLHRKKALISVLTGIGEEFDKLPKDDPIRDATWRPFEVCLKVIRQHEPRSEWDELTGHLYNSLTCLDDKVYFTEYLGYWFGKYGAPKTAILPSICSAELLARLEKQSLQLFGPAAKAAEFTTSDRLIWNLKRWRDWSGSDKDPKAAIAQLATQDPHLVEIAFRCSLSAQNHYSTPLDDFKLQSLKINVTAMREFLDFSAPAIRDRLGKVLAGKPGWLTDEKYEFLQVLVPVLNETSEPKLPKIGEKS